SWMERRQMSPARCWLPFVAVALLVGCSSKTRDLSDDKPQDGGTKSKPKTDAEPPGDKKKPDGITKPKARQKFDAAARYEKRYGEARESKAQTPEMDRALKRLAREAAADGASEYVCKCVEGLSAKEQDDCAE